MSTEYTSWSEVKDKARQADPRLDGEREAGQVQAVERREAYIRGHQLAEMRKAAGLMQADVAKTLGIDIIRAYVSALGGTVELVATLGDRSWKVA